MTVSPTARQMATCRQIARVGQLILNRGLWLRPNKTSSGSEGNTAGGEEVSSMVPFRMADEGFMRAMLQPAAPGIVEGYGFLT